MTDGARASVWDAVWLPWGNSYSITGTAAFNARLPGQWFQIEAGLHYNWHRSYDPTIGRYTQPDPLGFVDGPSVYGYARASPLANIDVDGHMSSAPTPKTPPSSVQMCQSQENEKCPPGGFEACFRTRFQAPRCLAWVTGVAGSRGTS